jgi:SAM-dependent methyltransferase
MELTDRAFWSNYWRNKKELYEQPVRSEYLFTPLFGQHIQKYKPQSAVELGGFPGTFSVHLHQKFKVKTTLVDYFIDEELLQGFFRANGIQENELHWKEADVLSSEPVHERFDLVFSIGLIEHFENTGSILYAHRRYLNDNGSMLIILPNFKGLNGWFQRVFDRENYDKHFIQCMNPELLSLEFKKLGFNQVESHYFGGFTIWLENYTSQNVLVKGFFKAIWILGKIVSKVLPIKGKWFSPYIYVSGKL